MDDERYFRLSDVRELDRALLEAACACAAWCKRRGIEYDRTVSKWMDECVAAVEAGTEAMAQHEATMATAIEGDDTAWMRDAMGTS